MAKTYYMRWIAALLLAFSAQSKADEWTNADIGLETAYALVTVADWGQTLNIDCVNAIETNQILGSCPSRGRVNTYFLTALVLHPLVSNYLPGKWRTAFQLVTIGIEVDALRAGASLGVKIRF